MPALLQGLDLPCTFSFLIVQCQISAVIWRRLQNLLQLPPAKSRIVTGKAEKEDQRPTATGCPYTACGHGFLARDASGLNIHNVCLNGSQILVARMHHTHDIKRTGTPT